MKYKHIFFDLDHTLWDFEKNSTESLDEIYYNWSLEKHGIASAVRFIDTFKRINSGLWAAFDLGHVPHAYIRENRFRLVFEELGIECPDNHLHLNEVYLQILPTKKYLLDGAMNVLEYLSNKGYVMHIITNGFTEVQSRKIAASGIGHFFVNVVTNEIANAKKPDPKIFEYALAAANASKESSIMIGDNWVADIEGARKAGIDAVYYNPANLQFEEKPDYNIQHLNELMHIL